MSNATIQVSSKETKSILKHMIENNRYLQGNGKYPIAVEIEGTAGIGKTSLVKQLGDELNLPVVRLNLAELEEVADLTGFPLRQFQMCKGENCIWVDEHTISSYEKEGFVFTGLKRMTYAPPEWIAGKEKGMILCLDDYSRADSRFIQATMQLIQNQEYISWKLPEDTHIILTSNPEGGDYLVNVMDTAQRTRFISIKMKFDLDSWAEWAEFNGIDTRCINFLLFHPEVITEKTNARALTTFFNSISSIKDFSANLPMIQLLGEAAIGGEISTMFALFINNRLDKLLPPKTILTHKDYDKVIETIKATIGKDAAYRADIAAVMTRRILNYSLFMCQEGTMDNSIVDRITKLVVDNIFTNDLSYYLVKGLLEGDKVRFQKMMLNPAILKMAVK